MEGGSRNSGIVSRGGKGESCARGGVCRICQRGEGEKGPGSDRQFATAWWGRDNRITPAKKQRENRGNLKGEGVKKLDHPLNSSLGRGNSKLLEIKGEKKWLPVPFNTILKTERNR